MGILVFNAGSSSLKVAFFDNEPGDPVVSKSIDLAAGELTYRDAAAQAWEELGDCEIDAIAHRVVHGGASFCEPVRLSDTVRAQLNSLNDLAPLHNPAAIEVIDFVSSQVSETDQFAVFDTAFFASLPERAAVFSLPYEWYENRKIRRYGFHGISHEYCLQQSVEQGVLRENDSRLIVCHLGNGCSVSAIRGGNPIATTMGFTPLDGVVMGTRPGSIDPGVLLHLLKTEQFSVDELDEALNRKSGLLGISGVSSDFRELHNAIQSGDHRAELALQIFADSVRGAIASYATQMGGLDGLIFTGGIGEHSADARERICDGLEIIGCELDSKSIPTNGEVDRRISSRSSSVEIWIIQAREELSIARRIQRLL
ncbi:UNVERIFIED_CONTAM: hypothetical protein GTU68_023755 [Idotea baltica]|nr:hypothetical protein [Idotea baltica]